MHPPLDQAPPILDLALERTLTAWVQRFSQPQWRGKFIEGWLFESPPARRAAEQQLAAAGVQARFHSAYKPLVQFFLDEVVSAATAAQLASVHIDYPQPAAGDARRFALEAYPLAALLPAGAVQLLARSDQQPWYGVRLRWHGGRTRTARIHAPNRQHPDSTGTPVLSPTGWLRVGSSAGLADVLDSAVSTDYEEAWQQIMQAVARHPWPAQEPYFERLDIRIDLPGYEQPITWADETISTLEALHEDVYFSLLEFFQQHSGRTAGDRRLQPGQIVPDVRAGAEQVRVRVQLRAFEEPEPPEGGGHGTRAEAQGARGLAQNGQPPLELLDSPPPAALIERIMRTWPAERFSAPTRQGRAVQGCYRAGSQEPVFISAGQHANETSGIVGALRAAQALHAQPGAHFALIALENPDGYALHRELCQQHPGHMHHAARYSALGDDIEYREHAPLLERQARQTALALSGARLHVNLHGYPAHEWTRPLSGYMPRGFADWMLPKGFFLILRHHSGWQGRARALLHSVCRQLLQVPGLAEFNQRQRQLYECHAGPLPFEVIDGIACMVQENTRDAPVTLISEFPDETIHGPAFRFAHTVQMQTVLAAVRAWQHLARASENVGSRALT